MHQILLAPHPGQRAQCSATRALLPRQRPQPRHLGLQLCDCGVARASSAFFTSAASYRTGMCLVQLASHAVTVPDSTMQAIRVGQVRRLVCVSPGYLAQFGTPRLTTTNDSAAAVAGLGLTRL